VLLHQGLQGFLDINGLGGQFSCGVGLDLKQFDIGQSFFTFPRTGEYLA